MKKLLLLILTVLFLAGCGGSSGSGGNQGTGPLTLNTSKANALIGRTVQFTSSVPADWSVTEPSGGSITNDGLYTAPANTGTFHIVAKGRENPSQTATASIDVAAEFLSLQKYLAGTSQPYSVSPMLTKLFADGTLTSALIQDSATGQQADTNAYDIFLAADGMHAAFTNLTNGTYGGEQDYFFDIGLATASADISTGTANVTVTQLTHNDQNQNFYTMDWFPQISPDGKTIIDTHFGSDPITGAALYGIGKMNLDGTNFQMLFQKPGVDAFMPTFSPDGKMIAVRMRQALGDGYYDGIATMNADGSNVVQLTGGQNPSTDYCWDDTPAYASDGKKIVFARVCYTQTGGMYAQLYSMNPDGTGIRPIHGPASGGFVSYQPRAFANGSVVFSTNIDNPGIDAFDMYSILPDGSKLTRITNNNLYDGFSIYWINYNEMTAAARAFRAHSPVEQRLEHWKKLRQMRAR